MNIKGIGPAYKAKLAKLGIKTVDDLLHHTPSRYVDLSKTQKIKDLEPNETVTIVGQVISITPITSKKGKRMMLASISDGDRTINAIWFNQMYLMTTIPPGTFISLSGKITFWNRKLSIFSPQFEKVNFDGETIHTGRIVPIYPETQGLSSKWLRRILKNILDSYKVEDFLDNKNFLDYNTALNIIHFPENLEEAEEARRRLALNELIQLQLENHARRIEWQKNKPSQKLVSKKEYINKFVDKLPFKLTDSQNKALDEIVSDLQSNVAMNRLLEGDVGSGKTVVAAAAAYVAFKNNFKSVFLAPTQILAHQHVQTLENMLSPLGIKFSLVTSGKKPDLDADIYIGTHALLHKKDLFKRVALVIIDEQHRFGVNQRAEIIKLTGKDGLPNVITMTATPIPRTIALTLFGDLDISSLTELPLGRKPITTWVVPPIKRKGAYKWIEEQIQKDDVQIFVVCPLINESESEKLTQVKAASVEYESLKKIFKKRKVGLLHGKLKPAEKEEVLKKFRDHKIDILVSTPVVEVGIDIPNACVMMIEAADRFGLAALHQLRGRVGRGEKKSYCLLLTENKSEKVSQRLDAISKNKTGKELAEIDMATRGPGEIFGLKQSGFGELRIAHWTDIDLIKLSKKIVENAVKNPKKHTKLLNYFKNKQVVDN